MKIIKFHRLGTMLIVILWIFFIYAPVFSFAEHFKVKIIKVSDGDTVWVEKHGVKLKLRLLGIDTPEEYHSKKLDEDLKRCGVNFSVMRQLGVASAKHAETMLRPGQTIEIITKGKGYYGRTLAWIVLSNGDIYNEKEVADGYAWVYKYKGHKSKQVSSREFSRLNKLMRQARQERQGLWNNYFEIMDCLSY